MIKNVEFIKEHYADQIDALNGFIQDAYPYLPNKDNSLIRFGGGTALAIYYFQHRLSFDIDLFVTDAQLMNYLSPKHWLEEADSFNGDTYVDIANHIRVLYRRNNIKIDVLVAQDFLGKYLVDASKEVFQDTVYIESIEDIIAKKIIYRRNDNLTRDIIDIAISIKYADNVVKRLYEEELISLNDIDELFNSLSKLDRDTFDEELEIVKPFEKYISTAIQAPDIILQECTKILDRFK